MIRRSLIMAAIAVALVICRPDSASAQAINQQDSLALVNIYEDMGGPGWTSNQNWLEGPVSSWSGVTTTDDRVTELDLFNNGLTGTITGAFGNLTELTRLELGSNSLPGSIPSGIGQLVKLRFLDLSGNLLTGSIPGSMANLVQLEDLFLYNNRRDGNPGLTGPIPGFLGGLSKLRNLEIDANGFTGQIPESLGDLNNLIDLFIGGNYLSGAVPSSIGQMPSLEILGLNDNQLEDLPDLSGLPNLLGLYVHNNRFTFEDLEPNLNAAQVTSQLAPQDSVETEVNGNTLSVTVGGSSNEYQWYREPFFEISGATDRTFTPDEPGTYHCVITSPLVPGVWLSSKPVAVGGLVEVVVNIDSDEPDLNQFDEVCDVDAQTDGMQCSLRAAIQTVNASDGDVTIRFDIPGDGVPVIRPGFALPAIQVAAEIAGTTQPGGRVELDGINAGAADGLLVSGSDVSIRGLMINRFQLFGIRVNGGSGHVIERNVIGSNEDETELQPNGLGGILVDGGAENVRIGGEVPDERNLVIGGIRVMDDDTRGVRILRNIIRIPEEDPAEGPLFVPVDLGNDGPTCSEWDATPDAPNRTMPPPRIVSLSGGRVAGVTRPGATIVLYRVEQTGAGRSRYFAWNVRPIDIGTADEQGLFDIPVALEAGTIVAATATDTDGNTSELSQLRRPVIFLPGVGGSWLEGANGDNLWLPGSAFDSEINDRFARLAMDPNGEDIEAVTVDGIVEVGGFSTYGPVLEYLEDAGYTGADLNAGPETLDLWRFAYDWRRDVNLPAVDLKTLIDRLVGGGQDVARSCEVDILAHSNGGMVASVYLRTNPEHGRNHVHRFVTSGTPYLGSTQVAAAHTRGYMFGIDETIPIDMEWGRIIQMFRNLPGAYGLLPSRAYWDAVNPNSESHLPFYLEDLEGNSLRDYESTFEFMTSPKTGTFGRPEGLGRNRTMWMQQQAAVHDVMDDWRGWSGPPQIYRMVGDLADGTATGWILSGDLPPPPDDSPRTEPGDTPTHVSYRESLLAIVGLGDGTVPLASATLGHDARVGHTDFSGVGTGPWIQDFEEYPCKHVPLVGSSCFRRADNLSSLVRIEQILKSGYEVVPGSEVVPEAAPAGKQAGGSSILYIQASAPVVVTVADESGLKTGPTSFDEPGLIEYGIPDVGYWTGLLGSVVSLPDNDPYSLSVRSSGAAATVRVSRLIRGEADRSQVLFPDVLLEDGGSMTASIDGGNPTAGFDVDADGNGTYESQVQAGVTIQTDVPIPAVPRAVPGRIDAEGRLDSPDPVSVSVEIPDVGGANWQWTLTDTPDWIEPDQADGQTPAVITLSFDTDVLDAGVHTGDMIVDLTLDSFTRSLRIPVEFILRDQEGTLDDIVISPVELTIGLQSSHVFEARGLDQDGLPFGFGQTWSSTGGTIDEGGLFYSGDEPGMFVVTVADDATGLSSEATVEVIDVDVARDRETIPSGFELEANYPDPAIGSTTIGFGLPAASRVHLSVHDVLGRTVAVLVDDVLGGGSYQLRYDVSGLPSGTYLVRLTARNRVMTESVTVIR